MNEVRGTQGSFNSSNIRGPIGTATRASGADQQTNVKEAFRDFVGGTFYQQMLKSLRKSTTGKAAYMNGGKAEEMFRGQLDQQIADDLARSHGGNVADSLYDAFSRRMK